MDSTILFKNLIKFFVEKEKIKSFEDKLFLNKSKTKNIDTFIQYSIVEGIILMISTMVVFATMFNFGEENLLIGIVAFFIPFLLNYIYQDVLFEKRKRKREDLLPDLLLEGSVFCDQKSLLKTIHSFSKQEIQLLNEDFKRVYLEIKNGASIEEALEHNKTLNKSESYNRVIDLLLGSYSSGGCISSLLRELAEDLMESKAIIKERQAVMLITKYTLLLSAGIIVPAILGTVIGLVTGLGFETTKDVGIGLSLVERKELFEIAVLGTTIYILEYSVLSSFFLALQEGNKKQFWIYLLILVPCATVAFVFAQGLLIT
ncbi:MAG: hypothetical protein HON47_03090 [Candidatus Diapherotrites archaeon]|jgi:Flp pilus assembly protein TadB|uniref:Type II secretion system protein GspF domain-containing protein n=1 Tax=Candidatus Iainarchaeum sp. TaxID=3101447 RepID=A0A8T5GEX9_9ARCH|nr:hypothetical protein [Candidatus Diapherotrites archaeon]